jgi:hypothetical protein
MLKVERQTTKMRALKNSQKKQLLIEKTPSYLHPTTIRDKHGEHI